VDEGKIDPKNGNQIVIEVNNWLEVISQEYEIVPTSTHTFGTSIKINQTTKRYYNENSNPAISISVNFRIHLDANFDSLTGGKKLVDVDLKLKNEVQVLVESWQEKFGLHLDDMYVTISKKQQVYKRGDADIQVHIDMLGPDGKRIPVIHSNT